MKIGSVLTNISIFVLVALVRILINRNLPVFIDQDNPASHEKSFSTRLLTYLYLGSFNLNTLIYPNNLSYDWQMGSIPLVQSIQDQRNIHSILLLSLLTGLCIKIGRHGRGDLLFAYLFLILP